MKRRFLGLPVGLLLAVGTAAWSAPYSSNLYRSNSQYNGVRQTVLPAGSVLKVQLNDTLSSNNNQRGDRFTATVADNSNGYNLPSGTRVEGAVTDVRPAASNQPGMLDVHFSALRLPDGQSFRIAGAPISLDSSSVQSSSDGRLTARSSHKNDKMKFLAYGAGAGFVIGSLLGSNIKGALAGGAAGYLYGMLNKKNGNGRDVVLKPGTQFGVRLDQRVALASAGYNGYRTGAGTYRPGLTNNRANGYNNSASGYNNSASGYNTNNANRSNLYRSGSPNGAIRQTVLPAGSVLKVQLNDTLSSNSNQRGDRFTATVADDSNGYGLPSGTRVEGEIADVQSASSDRPGQLDVNFTALRLPDGHSFQIAGAPISLDSSSVQSSSDGRLTARSSHKNDKMKFLAYGAGAGFVIGSLLGSNIKGALAGGAAGYLYGLLNKNKSNGRDVVLKPGTQFGVRLDQQVALATTGGYSYPSRVGGYRSNQ